MSKIVYDGEGAVLGRLASTVAKDLLKGDEVEVINCEKIMISGDKKKFVERVNAKRRMGSGSSMKGPTYPRSADRLVKRMIRGMLPWDKAKGRDAYKRLKIFVGGENDKAIKLEHRKPMRFCLVEDVVRLLK